MRSGSELEQTTAWRRSRWGDWVDDDGGGEGGGNPGGDGDSGGHGSAGFRRRQWVGTRAAFLQSVVKMRVTAVTVRSPPLLPATFTPFWPLADPKDPSNTLLAPRKHGR